MWDSGSFSTESFSVTSFDFGAIIPAETIDTHDGGGKEHGWYRSYKHPNEFKKHRKPIAAEIREMYEAMVEVAAPVELAKINSVIAEYVEKPSIDCVNLSALVQPPAIDWIALANDLENVYALARIYDRLLAEYEDEAAFMLLM